MNSSKINKNNLNPHNWVEVYGDFLLNYCITRVYSRELARDIVQETFVSAFQAMDSFQEKSSERTWLISILKRKIIDHYRKKNRRGEQLTDNYELPFKSNGFWEGHWMQERRPNEWLSKRIEEEDSEEISEILRNCLELLPEKTKACFTLKTMEEHSTEKICKELGISASNLWVILHRARLQLRECVEKKWKEQDEYSEKNL